jgi:hypothetical protein
MPSPFATSTATSDEDVGGAEPSELMDAVPEFFGASLFTIKAW